MLTLVLGLALAQAPKVVVVQSSNLGVSAKRAGELTQLLLDVLAAEKVEAVESKTSCESRVCVIATAKRAGAAGAISLNFASLGKDAVMDLESVDVSNGKAIAQTTFTAKSTDTKLPFEALAFVADTRRALPVPAAAPPKVAENDAPKQTSVTPADPPPSSPVTAEASSSPVPGVRVGLLIGTVAVGAAALAMLFAGMAANQEADRTEPGDPTRSVHSRAGAQGWVDVANFRWTVAGGLGTAAAALAVASVLTFAF